MADEIISVLQTLYNHRQLVRDVCVENEGAVPETEETEAAIRALKKQGLVWQMGELDAVSLSRPLLYLLRSAMQRRSRRLASGNVDRLWMDLCERVDDYSVLYKEGKTDDLTLVEMDIRDALHELADTISHDIRSYADYLDHGFAYVRDPDLRVKQNERAIARAKALNDYLGGINVHELVAGSHLNSRLRNVLQAGFAVAIRDSKQELVNTLHRLNELLITLRRDSELNKLLRVFELKFKNEPGFQANIPELFDHIPPVLDIAASVIRPSREVPSESSWNVLWGDIYSPASTEALAEMARKLRPIELVKDDIGLSSTVAVEDTREQTAIAETDHPIVASARGLVRAIQQLKKPLSLNESRIKLEVDCPPSLWMAAVLNIIEALPEAERLRYKLEYQEFEHPLYSGNRWVEDIRLEYLA